MVSCLYLNGHDFEKTSFRYGNSISPNCNIAPYRKKYRISYVLPNKERDYFYKLDPKNFCSETAKKRAVLEFESLIRKGYFPKNSISKLKKFKIRSKKGQTTFSDGMDLYYTTYNKGKNYKRPKNIKNQRTSLNYQLEIFQKKTGKQFLEEVTTDDLIEIEDRFQEWCEELGRPINNTTFASYKRMLKAYFNCLAKRLRLDMNPAVISSNPEPSGYKDKKPGTRTVVIPEELLDAVDKFPFTTPDIYPDRKEIIHLYRVTGIAKAELATLSEENLHPDKSNFDSIILMDKPDCPTNDGMGFQVKTHNRNGRVIPLDERVISFIKCQMIKHKDHAVYGRIKNRENLNYKPYRFLFPVFNNGKWQRCDNFLYGIQNLFAKVIKEYELPYNANDYNVHDFRTTLNEKMGDMDISAEDRAYILGHSKEVNENNYLNAKKKKELQARKAHVEFKEKFLNKNENHSPRLQ